MQVDGRIAKNDSALLEERARSDFLEPLARYVLRRPGANPFESTADSKPWSVLACAAQVILEAISFSVHFARSRPHLILIVAAPR